jgi:putative membrane protein
MIGLLIRWAINAVALYLTALIVHGIHVTDFASAVVAGLVLGIVNAVIRPIVLLLTLPLNILTLGIFTLVINALMLYIVAGVTHRLQIDNFFSAFFGAIVLSVISVVLSHLVKDF